MIYLELLWSFLKIGTFSFGGAYGAIPLIREVVLSHSWITDEQFTYFVAVSESTPGPIMVNLATYIGSTQAGFGGALIATIGVVMPSFLFILVIASLMQSFIKNQYIQAILRGIKPCFIGIVLSMGLFMTGSNLYTATTKDTIDWRAWLISIILIGISFVYPKIKKKDLSPIMLIILSAGLGILTYTF